MTDLTSSASHKSILAEKGSFVSFDGSTRKDCVFVRPKDSNYYYSGNFPDKAIARGAGLSYTAASFGGGAVSIVQAALNKIIDFNQAEEWIEIEAGASLGQLYDFLIEKNLFLATQPGHPRISIGGCIAPDIHGKNQFLDGTFMNQVVSLKMFHPMHGILDLSQQENPDLFRLTCGAYGLTGNIISCKLKLKTIPSTNAEVSLKPLRQIEDLPASLRESSRVSDFVLSWHDFTLKGKDFGRGFIQEGRFCNAEDSEKPLKRSDEHRNSRRKKAAEQTLDAETRGGFPIAVFNPLTVKLMNMLYGSRCRGNGSTFEMSLFDSIFPIQNSKELYFKFFGEGGFHEYQVILPEKNFAQYVYGVRDYIATNPISITLASAKLFSGTQDLLRFSGEGICFALNFSRSNSSLAFLQFLDKLLLECGGIPNIIKDSRLTIETVSAAYPQYEEFRRKLREFDPQRIFRSELSERLAL